MKLSEILTGPETWGQGALHSGGRYCILGALGALHGVDMDRVLDDAQHPVWKEIYRLAQQAGVSVGDLIQWNDRSWTTWEKDVAAVVDAYDRDRMLNP